MRKGPEGEGLLVISTHREAQNIRRARARERKKTWHLPECQDRGEKSLWFSLSFKSRVRCYGFADRTEERNALFANVSRRYSIGFCAWRPYQFLFLYMRGIFKKTDRLQRLLSDIETIYTVWI